MGALEMTRICESLLNCKDGSASGIIRQIYEISCNFKLLYFVVFILFYALLLNEVTVLWFHILSTVKKL